MSEMSKMLAAKIDKYVDEYLDAAKKAGIKLTRDDVITVISQRLEGLIKDYSLDDEMAWVASGMAVGVATVLTIEYKLKAQK